MMSVVIRPDLHMPFVLLLIALFLPRLVIALLWLFSDWFTVVPHWVIGILGFLLLPYTFLWYTAVEQWFAGEWGPLQIVVLILAVLADLGIPSGSRRRRSDA